MPKKVKHEEHENHERWLVSYADFITLLFAFFVVMYSVSSVNEGKYRVLSESMDAAFRSANKSMSPIQIGSVVRKPHEGTSHSKIKIRDLGLSNLPPPRFSEPVRKKAPGKKTGTGNKQADRARQIKNVTEDIRKAMLPLIEKGLVKVNTRNRWIEVDIKSSILFPSGGAHLARQAIPVLERIANILKPLQSAIHVEGFTDNIPISNLVYPSNWELSAARAASVVHLFSKVGVNPKRMAAVGYGEYHPVASNKTVEGRQQNRRVVLRINTAPDSRFMMNPNGSDQKSADQKSADQKSADKKSADKKKNIKNKDSDKRKKTANTGTGQPRRAATNKKAANPATSTKQPARRAKFPVLSNPIQLPPLR